MSLNFWHQFHLSSVKVPLIAMQQQIGFTHFIGSNTNIGLSQFREFSVFFTSSPSKQTILIKSLAAISSCKFSRKQIGIFQFQTFSYISKALLIFQKFPLESKSPFPIKERWEILNLDLVFMIHNFITIFQYPGQSQMPFPYILNSPPQHSRSPPFPIKEGWESLNLAFLL